MNTDIHAYLAERRRVIDEALRSYLPPPTKKPRILHEAMSHSLFAGGKRLRPTLCLAACEAVGGDSAAALPLACAVECVHTYSLIHDDLPAMDNDDWRRGKPTLHKIYGEAVAILAGDALLAEAFEIACRYPGGSYGSAVVVGELARASGSRALVAGQVADLEAEGKEISVRELRAIHLRKTGALITTSLRLGAMAGEASRESLRAITEFGRFLGLAFQVIDDILDLTQTRETLGKSAGKDLAAEKATYPRLLGLEGAQQAAQRYTARAHEALAALGTRGATLAALARHLLARES
ncbi:geranylgeranyl diphosphate synthase, type II [Methylacidimicrobium cyclopophantes]|uniref:Geranylgeranyl diphosphate synthase, type II n=1 Tax=Methylacidimicrobium cyclopophantes TaxID=1041766 RepID=A0A5E6MQP2_9BACT|nr:farnesyl diphosphate synthase [Methylacidimicrobium cyclopophantes]VVM08502.1 geranylgeranyl diphosphate synthase, type II [Methylacidimicrobium cyclopophantes]